MGTSGNGARALHRAGNRGGAWRTRVGRVLSPRSDLRLHVAARHTPRLSDHAREATRSRRRRSTPESHEGRCYDVGPASPIAVTNVQARNGHTRACATERLRRVFLKAGRRFFDPEVIESWQLRADTNERVLTMPLGPYGDPSARQRTGRARRGRSSLDRA